MQRISLAVLALAAACGGHSSAGTQANFDPTLAPQSDQPGTWLAFPFPSDHRRTADGHIKLSDFPNPSGADLVTSYATLGETLDGFSTNGAIYVAFNSPLDTSTLPSDLKAGLSPSGPLQIVDITPASPEYGQGRPVRWEWHDSAGRFVAANMLAVAPAAGFPLREKTTYALLVTDAVSAKGSALHQPTLLASLLAGDATAPDVDPSVSAQLYSELLAEYAPLRDLLSTRGQAPAHIMAATVFTTQSITSDLKAVFDQIAQGAAPAYRDAWQTPEGAASGFFATNFFEYQPSQSVSFQLMEGRYTGENYEEGSVPYATTGGALHFENGAPKPVREEDMRFVLSIPASAPRSGKCYRLVEISHGTGGDAYSFVLDGTAGRLAAHGLAAVSIDQPLHGLRADGQSFDVNMMSFNYLNPAAARSLPRQSAIDVFQLTRFVRESLHVPAAASFTGTDLCFDPAPLGFFGHSQGGITGALTAAFQHEVSAWMLSGAGGVLSTTLVERTDPTDVRALISFLLGLPAGEELTELHPASTLMQTVVEVTDPVNYSPYWSLRSDFGAPVSVMMTSGLHDTDTPYRTADALALAGGLPFVAPIVADSPEFDASDLSVASAPSKANLAAGATGGLLQWTNDLPNPNYDNHFVVFNRPEAIHASMRFLESSAFEGGASIERDPNATDQ